MRRKAIIWAFLLSLCGFIPQHISHAQAPINCIEAPLSCIGEPFKDMWLKNNGPENFGVPMNSMQSQMVNGEQHISQEFERVRIDYFPTRLAPNNYIIARVGAEWLDANIGTLFPISEDLYGTFMPGVARCQDISAGSPAVCGPFLDYYLANGINIDALPYVHPAERKARFGLPLTPAMKMVNGNETRIVQVFERARLDWYPDDPYFKTVKVGAVVNEMVEAGQPRPTGPSEIVNQLVDTNQPVLSYEEYGRWQWGMPQFGYWSTSNNGIYVATSTIRYQDEFWSIKAPKGYRFVSMTVLLRNERDRNADHIYIDYSYLSLIDHIGNRLLAYELSQQLDKPIQPVVIKPGETYVGQIIFLISDHTIPSQLEINIANLDAGISRFTQYIELRTPPKS